MSQRTRFLAIWGALLTAQLTFAVPTFAAEFRSSVRGKTLVRPANYEQPAEEIAPLRVADIDSYTHDSSDYCDGSWDGNCGAGCCSPCGLGWTYWGSFEFLMWWRKGQNLPPLVTTSPTATPENDAGVLGIPGTQVLYATETQSGDARPGGRLTMGVWFDPCQFSGVGTRWFALGESTAHYDQDSSLVPVLARPFFNTDSGAQDAVQIAYPGSADGAISVRNTSRVGGGDVFYRRLLFQGTCRRIDLIAGYQYSKIDTDLSVTSDWIVRATGGDIAQNSQVQVVDSFDTTNTYNAGELGLWSVYDRGPVTWSLLAKVGLGNMIQRTAIAGRTTIAPPNATPSTTNQGLLALNSNSGIFKRNVFTVAPEIAFQGAYHLNDCIDLTFGYSFIFWNHVAQPGDQIDMVINPTQITGALVGPPRPAFPANDSSYYVHGLNFGVQWTW